MTVPQGLWLTALVAITATSNASLNTQDIEQLHGLNITHLNCRQADDRTLTSSLGIPIAHHHSQRQELVLLTRHGLVSDINRCTVSAAGEQRKLVRVITGKDSGLFGDWAVALLNKPLPHTVPRLQPRPVSHDTIAAYASQGGTIHLPRASAQLDRDCPLFLPSGALYDASDKDQIVLTTCPMLAGKSGAPAIARIDEQPALIGVALGYRFATTSDLQGAPANASVIRLVDANILQAMHELLGEH